MAARRAAETLDFLRRNDPTTFLQIRLREFLDDALSEALQANDHVNYLWLNLNGLANDNFNWDLLLRVLATREALRTVLLCDEYAVAQRNSPDRITQFVLALQQNPRIETMTFYNLQLSGASMAAYLDTAPSVTTLCIHGCGMEAPGGVLAVADALQRNTNIQRLQLEWLDEMYLVPILNSLAFNTSLKELEFCFYFHLSLGASLAVKNLLESTRTVEKFELGYQYADQCIVVDTFQPIAQGLIQSTSVTSVKFVRCKFDSQGKVLLLNYILESKYNLQSLALRNCTVCQDGRESFHAAIFSLLQPDSLVRSFELDHSDNLSTYGLETVQDCAQLFAAVETSSLERFSIGTIASRASCFALIASIPRMQVGTLELRRGSDLQDLKVDLLQAIRRNASLSTVVAYDWFDNDDRMKLNAYSTRNEFLGQWIENPTSVPRAAWPEYLTVAQTTGPDTVFRILQALTNVPVSWFEVGRNAQSAAVMMHRPNRWSTQRGIEYLYAACCCCRERIWESA
jgi:hypothetical protein